MRESHRRLIAVALFVGLIFLLYETTGLRDHLNREYLQQQLLEHQVIGLLLFTLAFALGNLAHIPGWAFLAVAVLTLGSMRGGIAIYIAASFSCVITFFMVRLVGGDSLRKLNSPLAQRILARLDARPLLSVLLLRLLFQTLPTLNYALALSGIRFRHYLYGTLLGLPIPITLYCLFFDSLSRIFHLV
jgi:uncharacterized membrane protein YdjX (TVP38/TMEM64 family)